MPLSKKTEKLLRRAADSAEEDGFSLFAFAYTDDFSGELGTFSSYEISRDQMADLALAVGNCLKDSNTKVDISGTCVPPTIN